MENLVNKLIALMTLSPALSIVCITILLIVVIIVFKSTLALWLRKWLNVYTPEEIDMAIREVEQYQLSSARIDPRTLSEKVLFELEILER